MRHEGKITGLAAFGEKDYEKDRSPIELSFDGLSLKIILLVKNKKSKFLLFFKFIIFDYKLFFKVLFNNAAIEGRFSQLVLKRFISNKFEKEDKTNVAKYAQIVLENTLKKTLGVSCMFMWIILAALTFGAVFDGLGAGRAIETLFIERWNLTPWGVLIMMQLSYILMGMFLDDTAMLVIVAPLYVPLIISLGFDPIWYGVLYTITCQIAYMTPPFGYNLF